jgi:hypothetical protein
VKWYAGSQARSVMESLNIVRLIVWRVRARGVRQRFQTEPRHANSCMLEMVWFGRSTI